MKNKSETPGLVRAQSDSAQEFRKKTLIRRHSSGDHAFLPSKADRAAIKASQRNFGVDGNHVQDGEVGEPPPTLCTEHTPTRVSPMLTARASVRLCVQGSRLPTTRGY
jgi:hypothetical protein